MPVTGRRSVGGRVGECNGDLRGCGGLEVAPVPASFQQIAERWDDAEPQRWLCPGLFCTRDGIPHSVFRFRAGWCFGQSGAATLRWNVDSLSMSGEGRGAPNEGLGHGVRCAWGRSVVTEVLVVLLVLLVLLVVSCALDGRTNEAAVRSTRASVPLQRSGGWRPGWSVPR